MKHLIVSREFPPSVYPQGGIGTYVAHIARLLAERGETVHVIGEQWSGAPAAREVLCDGRLIVHRVPLTEPLPETAPEARPQAQAVLDAMANPEYPVHAFSWQAALLAEALIEREGIDCIEAQDYEAPLYYFLVRRACGVGPARRPPCFVHLHSPMQFICHFNDWELGRPHYLTMKRMEDYVIQASDAALCPSRYLGQQVEEHYGLAAGSVARIPYPTGDTPLLERAPSTWETGTICYFGRIEGRKGVFEWIEAAAIVARERPGLKFEFIGSDTPLIGGERLSVREAIEARIPHDVKDAMVFLGVRPRAELWTRLAQARLVVVPSRWENFPNTCVEAMGTGVPVLSSPEGGMVEMIEDGLSGWIAGSIRPDALAAGLRRALDTPASKKAEMGLAAAAAIRRICNNSETVDRQLAFRQELVSRGPGRSLSVPRGHSSLTVAYGAPPGTPREPAQSVPMVQPHAGRRQGLAIVVVGGPSGAEATFRAGIAAQTVAPVAVVRLRDELAAVRQWLDAPDGPAGVALVDGGCQLAAGFVQSMLTTLERNAAVGVVSNWAGPAGETAMPAVPLAPQRPYLWLTNELSACPAFRTEALQPAAWMLEASADGVNVSDIALAVLLAGWRSVTYPDALYHRAEAATALHEALIRSGRSRGLAALRARFPEQVAWDAQEMLGLVRGSPPSRDTAAAPMGMMPLDAVADLARQALRNPKTTAIWVWRNGRRVLGRVRRGGR